MIAERGPRVSELVGLEAHRPLCRWKTPFGLKRVWVDGAHDQGDLRVSPGTVGAHEWGLGDSGSLERRGLKAERYRVPLPGEPTAL